MNDELATHMESKLTTQLEAGHVELVDTSAAHRGHAGAHGGRHFRLTLVSPRFSSLSPLERHRLVHRTLRDELAGPVHALEMSLYSPSEWPLRQGPS